MSSKDPKVKTTLHYTIYTENENTHENTASWRAFNQDDMRLHIMGLWNEIQYIIIMAFNPLTAGKNPSRTQRALVLSKNLRGVPESLLRHSLDIFLCQTQSQLAQTHVRIIILVHLPQEFLDFRLKPVQLRRTTNMRGQWKDRACFARVRRLHSLLLPSRYLEERCVTCRYLEERCVTYPAFIWRSVVWEPK